MKQKNLSLIEGNPVRLILIFAFPIFVGRLFQIFYGLIDTKIVGSILGEDALAAVGSVSVLYNLLVGFFNGLTLGFSVITARFYGSNDTKRLKKTVAGGITIGYTIEIVTVGLVVIFLKPILQFLNVPVQQYEMAYQYIQVLNIGMFVTLAYNLCANSLRAIGDSMTPLFFLILSSVANIFLDYLFILYFHMGVMGAGIATVLAQILSVVLCIVRIKKTFPVLHISRADFKPDQNLIGKMLESGISMGLMSCLVSIGTLLLQAAINTLGTKIIVAHTAARKVFEIWCIPGTVLGSAMATFCGQNYGAHRYDRIKQGLRGILLIGFVWAFFVMLMAWTISPYLISFIASTADSEIIDWGTKYLKTDMLFMHVCVLIVILRNSMQGFGDAKTPIVSSSVELLGKIVFAGVLVRQFGYWAVIWTEPIIWILMVIPLIVMTWKNPVMKKTV